MPKRDVLKQLFAREAAELARLDALLGPGANSLPDLDIKPTRALRDVGRFVEFVNSKGVPCYGKIIRIWEAYYVVVRTTKSAPEQRKYTLLKTETPGVIFHGGKKTRIK